MCELAETSLGQITVMNVRVFKTAEFRNYFITVFGNVTAQSRQFRYTVITLQTKF